MPLLKPVPSQELPGGPNLLQSPFWALFKSRFGWKPHAFLLGELPLLLLERELSAGFSLVYAPHPFDGARQTVQSCWSELKDELTGYLKGGVTGGLKGELKESRPQRRICLRLDLPWELGSVNISELPGAWGLHGLRKAVADIQPPSTVIMPVEESEEKQLAAMKSKTRYNIRLAGRKGVVTRLESPEFIDTWYDLYRETAVRDRISIHSREYYRGLFTAAADSDDRTDSALAAKAAGSKDGVKAPRLHIISARHEGDLLAALIIAVYGGRATYLYGASSDQKRNLMASYAAQQAAISLARDEGCSSYDLFGIPPADDPRHPMHGLYRFKTGFGGRIIHRAGAWDLPLSPTIYPVYRQAELLRDFYYKRLKKHKV